MAQPVFDEHPLQDYFRESGEAPDILPGGYSGFTFVEKIDSSSVFFYGHRESVEKLCLLIFEALEMIGVLFSPRVVKGSSQFAERFKYDVISSSLLTAAFSSTTHPNRRSMSPMPGKVAGYHSRNTNSVSSLAYCTPNQDVDPNPTTPVIQHETPLWPLPFAITLAVAAFSAGCHALALLLVVAALYYVYVHNLDGIVKPDIMKPSLEALQNLISSGQVWDSMFQDAFDLIEREETIFYTTPSSPTSPLRIALHTALLTTQTQCDHVRQLLAALTSPRELAQLSEMYAPPSPMKPTFSINDSPRPHSLPSHRTPSTPETNRKRSTWNGSYSALALAGSPTFHMATRREKRRSDLSTLLRTTSPARRSSTSAPPSPSPHKKLPGVQEESDQEQDVDDDMYFGVAALRLQRKQKCGGLETLGLSQSTPRPPSPTDLKRSLGSSGSRFTLMQPTRHPLSSSSLHQALQSAMGSKRYACSHLLALRFEDGEDEGYWEDVRSVMALLTSTLADASTRLSEVLDEVDEQRLKDQEISISSQSMSRSESNSPLPESQPTHRRSRTISQSVSFAPMPNQCSRFAAHVDAIFSALADARINLDQCVASLKADSLLDGTGQPPDPSQDHPALQAYERLRRELGLALRECERGRERLIDTIYPPITPPIEEDEEDDMPALGPDGGSEASDKPDLPVLDMFQRDDEGDAIGVTVVSHDGREVDADDVTHHLLLSASPQHLPLPGVEQVFETDTESNVAFSRERSKLTREERIKQAKAKRTHEDTCVDSKVERWGPGGEVVQELKDVIWKVGERRRKMTEGHISNVVSAASSFPGHNMPAVELLSQTHSS